MFAIVASLAMLCVPARAELIRSFNSEIRLEKNATLDVTETIAMDFQSTPRHGIFRHIPVRYDRHGGAYTVEFRLVSVTDEAGSPLKFSDKRQGREVNIRIGDPDTVITGLHTYKLHYTVRRAVNFFDGAPELYWNVTGSEWPYPIEHATATVIPPEGVSKADLRTTSYVGPPGSTATGQIDWSGDDPVFTAPQVLQPASEMTIVVGFPKGSVVPPSLLEEIWWFIRDWWPLVVFPALAIVWAFLKWSAAGRDENAGQQAIGVEWEPPKDLTPAEVGTLIDESCDTPDIIATLIDLAARGWLTIHEIKTEKILFLSSKDYEFRRTEPPPVKDALLDYERQFFEGIFGRGGKVRLLSSLKEQFYTNIAPIKKSIYETLTTRALFKQNPDVVRNKWVGAGVVLVLAGIVWLWATGGAALAMGLGVILAGIIFLCVANSMPAKTAARTRKLLVCQSFKRFVTLVEKDRIAAMSKSDPTIFGRLLPYAMVLGVADQWAEAFKDLMIAPPSWYSSSSNQPFNTYWFIQDLGHGMRTMQKTMTSRPAPKSSAGSGGSGFSGGSSGGGFGGGGGGSW